MQVKRPEILTFDKSLNIQYGILNTKIDMKKLLLATGLLISTISFSANSHWLIASNYRLPAQYVYIDADPKEPYYHAKDDCKDIKKGHKVEKVTLSEAVNKYHLKPCPDCFKPKK